MSSSRETTHSIKESKIEFKSGTTSTEKSRFELIPKAGLVRAALRFEEGLRKHGDKAWSNLSPNQSALIDREWLIDRCSHAIQHYFNLIDKLARKIPLNEGEDDAGAVAWAGIVLAAAMTMIESEENK